MAYQTVNLTSIQATIGMPSYLTVLVDIYLIGRRLCYATDNTQGSVLKSLLESTMHNDILNVPIAGKTTIVQNILRMSSTIHLKQSLIVDGCKMQIVTANPSVIPWSDGKS